MFQGSLNSFTPSLGEGGYQKKKNSPLAPLRERVVRRTADRVWGVVADGARVVLRVNGLVECIIWMSVHKGG